MSRIPFVHVDVEVAGNGAGERLPLGDHVLHHLRTVLRLPLGADVEVADGAGGSAPAVLEATGVTLTAAATVAPPPQPRLELAQALAKGRKLDEVLRQATELGVDAVHPLVTARSVPRLDAAKQAKAVARWDAVARAAAEQSRRARLPTIGPALELGALVGGGATVLVAQPGAPALPHVVRELWPTPSALPERLVLVIGPEGGLDEREVTTLTTGGAYPVGLGPTVLRTEHAGAAGLAVLAALIGRWS